MSMQIGASVLMHAIIDPQYDDVLRSFEKAVDRYDISEINIHGANALLNNSVSVPGFERAVPNADPATVNFLKRQFERLKKKGLKITVGGHEPLLPAGFFDLYPEALYVSNDLLWDFLRDRTTTVLREFAAVDRLEYHLWETDFLNDVWFFRGTYWAMDGMSYLGSTQYYEPADYLRRLFIAFAEGADAADRESMLLSFCHYPWQEKLMIEALKTLPRDLPLIFNHKSQPGDWDPYRPANTIMLRSPDRPAVMLFDGVGEYWGQAQVPYCFPSEIQARIRAARAVNSGIDSLCMRVHWEYDRHLFGTPNEVNFVAMCRCAENLEYGIDEIWNEWALERYGKKAAPNVISALRRTDTIGKLVYYFQGMWVQQHSQIASLPYLEAQVLHTGRSMIEWRPDEVEANALISRFMHDPDEEIIRVAVGDRVDALRLNRLSTDELEAAEPDMVPSEFARLHSMFVRQRHFIETAIPHIESFLRLTKQKRKPSVDNVRKLEDSLSLLKRKADEVEALYPGERQIPSAGRIREYVDQVRDAGKLHER